MLYVHKMNLYHLASYVFTNVMISLNRLMVRSPVTNIRQK